ncbi:hypothetical protein EZI54_02500 [Marinobacter halodurans]|uniref:Anti-sigma factor n=1 Tax=Marinobacter halodurans TaxID=2528979 RepID=A0ABY1ZPV6_9GAMM|nr:hypothetical protein [Marinobacter halodurans]TBW58759.1 hypothetical protein EZI54_02500 [Marinobacter halodurans]
MPGALRYRDPELCDQLASRYVTARMTPLSRRRLERLMRQEPVLEQAVARWADRMAPLHEALPAETPPAELWPRIKAAVQTAGDDGISPPTASRGPLFMWRTIAVTAVAAALALAVALWAHFPQRAETVTASYLAPLSHNGVVELVVSGYPGSPAGKAQLVVQWSRRHLPSDEGPLYLWAEDQRSQTLVYLGTFSGQNHHWTVSRTQWQAVAHSSRLLVSPDRDKADPATAEYIGPCLQLGDWQEKG